MAPSIISNLSLIDFVIGPLYLIIILFGAWLIQLKSRSKAAYFKYFLPGLLAKLIGAMGLCIIYLYYYKGGDTLNYFFSAEVMNRLLFINPTVFADILFTGDTNPLNLNAFTIETGSPLYKFDEYSFFVVRFSTPLVLLSFNSFIGASLLMATLSYTGIWKLYRIFAEQFPKIQHQMAVAILFLPSVIFWGSGILKDTITLSAIGWFSFAVYSIMNKGKLTISTIVILIISSFLLLKIKPYLMYAMIPSCAVVSLPLLLARFKTVFIRSLAFPLILIFIGISAYLLLLQIGNEKDRGAKFSINNAMDYAVVAQKDLRREEYKGNSFDIGEYDASLGSMAYKAPQAINGALFRPYLWEATNPVMLFSALENFFVLIITIRILIKIKIINLFSLLTQKPILLFAMTFAILIALSIGLSTSNFGTLVRYKIPSLPFYIATLFAIQFIYKESK